MNELKKCSKCEVKSLKSNFHKDSIKKDGYKSEFKPCSKEYYYVNRERILNNRKTCVKKNRAKMNLYKKREEKMILSLN